jgi:hypothetical protein
MLAPRTPAAREKTRLYLLDLFRYRRRTSLTSTWHFLLRHALAHTIAPLSETHCRRHTHRDGDTRFVTTRVISRSVALK